MTQDYIDGLLNLFPELPRFNRDTDLTSLRHPAEVFTGKYTSRPSFLIGYSDKQLFFTQESISKHITPEKLKKVSLKTVKLCPLVQVDERKVVGVMPGPSQAQSIVKIMTPGSNARMAYCLGRTQSGIKTAQYATRNGDGYKFCVQGESKYAYIAEHIHFQLHPKTLKQILQA